MLLPVCEALSAESISCLMLTSDCLQSEKEDTMLAGEERDEQCMVSTIVDGIDNGAVEDVFVYRASYSLSFVSTDTITWKNLPGKTESLLCDTSHL